MVDVDRRNPAAHAAGLRRLHIRAAASAAPSAARSGLASFAPLAESIVSRLQSNGVPVAPGLSDAELARAEAELGLSFPPDLRALLALALPAGIGFPDWRSSRQNRILRRSPVRRAPVLIPLFDRFYIPGRPSLAGNPVFYVDDSRICCCGFDLADFFRRDSALPSDVQSFDGKSPRWIEFWTDAAAADRRRRSSASSSSSSRSDRLGWVEGYLDRIGSILKAGGWGESDVREMVHVYPSMHCFGD